jgi:hypothetical protein
MVEPIVPIDVWARSGPRNPVPWTATRRRRHCTRSRAEAISIRPPPYHEGCRGVTRVHARSPTAQFLLQIVPDPCVRDASQSVARVVSDVSVLCPRLVVCSYNREHRERVKIYGGEMSAGTANGGGSSSTHACRSAATDDDDPLRWGLSLARRWKPKTGAEAMIGEEAQVVAACRPLGDVRVGLGASSGGRVATRGAMSARPSASRGSTG